MHWLLRGWLTSLAQQKVREAAAETLRKNRAQADRPSDQDERSAIPRCDVAVLFALREEAGGLVDRLTGAVTVEGFRFIVREGALGARRVAVVESGVGGAAAGHAAEAILDGHRPKWVISAGFAGGLTDGLKRGDIALAAEVADARGQSLRVALPPAVAALVENGSARVGRLLSVDQPVKRPADKRALGERHAAMAVDMESWAVAEVCRRRGVPLVAIRVVSDAVDDELPAEVDKLLAQKSFAGRLGAATGALLRRPSSAKDFYRLREQALTASDKLARVLDSVIRQLDLDGPPSA